MGSTSYCQRVFPRLVIGLIVGHIGNSFAVAIEQLGGLGIVILMTFLIYPLTTHKNDQVIFRSLALLIGGGATDFLRV
jgi:hypothetical protein